jgi:cation diffusion facilitator CzcD-associated flavoprotein CzcO
VLRKNVTPNFDIGCKRILFANNYYPALQAPNTTLIPHGLVKVEGNTVVAANGERHEVDVIIWGTGFEVSHPQLVNVCLMKKERLNDFGKIVHRKLT